MINIRKALKILFSLVSDHYVKSVRIRNFPGPYFPAFGLNTDQKNSEYGHFSRIVSFDKKLHCLAFSLSSILKKAALNLMFANIFN